MGQKWRMKGEVLILDQAVTTCVDLGTHPITPHTPLFTLHPKKGPCPPTGRVASTHLLYLPCSIFTLSPSHA